jgi:hypothetical protein
MKARKDQAFFFVFYGGFGSYITGGFLCCTCVYQKRTRQSRYKPLHLCFLVSVLFFIETWDGIHPSLCNVTP